MRKIKTLAIFCFVACTLIYNNLYGQHNKEVKTLIIFFDGLRPDYITPELMPNLHELKKKGSYGLRHHSVFPTVTRVNSASYATGAYPRTHGLMGNSVYIPEVDKTQGLDAGDAVNLLKILEETSGKLITSTSLGEELAKVGINFMVFSSGTTGQALLQNHKINKGAVINPELILPESLKPEAEKVLGIPPPYSRPNIGRHKWATNALLHFGLTENGPLVNAIWLSDPDGSAHSAGIGSPLAMESISLVDTELGRILDHIEKKGWNDKINIIFSTDHGFVTHIGTQSLSDFLVKEGFKKDKDSDDVIVVGGAIYVRDQNLQKIEQIVSALQSQDWVGALFTKASAPGSPKGIIEGTLSFDVIHWNHERSADILVDVNWDNKKNEYGYEGRSYSRGVAGHGSSSPYEIEIPLITYGPAFKKAYENALPTSNVDIVPTVLATYNIPVPEEMDGRVMDEFFNRTADSSDMDVKKEVTQTSVTHAWGTYTLTIEKSVLGNYQYIDFTQVQRNRNTVEITGKKNKK